MDVFCRLERTGRNQFRMDDWSLLISYAVPVAYSDYAVIYPKNNINAGKVKFTVVGLGEYYGTVTKAYTIKPRVVRTNADGNVLVAGKTWKKVDANDIGTYVTVTYINNVNKGKATVIITGSGGKYVGSKTAVFNIVPKSMK